jgi:alkylation response protein AidB-like acyl-CoA dehydrogenase
MDFRLDEQQLELRDTVHRFCARFDREQSAQRDGRVEWSTWREMAAHPRAIGARVEEMCP